MATIKSYFLWLQRIANGGTKAPNGGGISVCRFTVPDSRGPVVTGGSGGAPNRLTIDELELTAIASNLVFGQLTQARNSSASLGAGRIEGLFQSGNRRVILSFDNTLVESLRWLNGLAKTQVQFDVTLSIERLRFDLDTDAAGTTGTRAPSTDPFSSWLVGPPTG